MGKNRKRLQSAEKGVFRQNSASRDRRKSHPPVVAHGAPSSEGRPSRPRVATHILRRRPSPKPPNPSTRGSGTGQIEPPKSARGPCRIPPFFALFRRCSPFSPIFPDWGASSTRRLSPIGAFCLDSQKMHFLSDSPAFDVRKRIYAKKAPQRCG